MATIDDIRTQFPTPISAREDTGMNDCYCIGGALAMYFGVGDQHFPDYGDLTRYLRDINPHLSRENAYGFANQIINLNDAMRFHKDNLDAAWKVAEMAITYRQKEDV